VNGPANRNISLVIAGRNHVLSIAPGEEAHLRKLAAMVDERVSKLGLAHGQTEARMMLVTALVLADELDALQNAAPPPPPQPAPAPEPARSEPEPAQIDPQVLTRLAALADRVEKLAARLEQSDIAP
jgi:cell division protein ZapA